mgnify:CR=1 FL=1
MDEVLDAIVDRIVKAVDPDKIILFGSRSRGREGPHVDYDLLIVKGGVDNRRALAHQIYQVLADIPAAVDVLVETPERIERHQATRGFVYTETSEGRVVYER